MEISIGTHTSGLSVSSASGRFPALPCGGLSIAPAQSIAPHYWNRETLVHRKAAEPHLEDGGSIVNPRGLGPVHTSAVHQR